ncbi:TPA: hypothetical protein GXZ34_00145 [bacterium]|nr:hypothetical protein [bacterium]
MLVFLETVTEVAEPAIIAGFFNGLIEFMRLHWDKVIYISTSLVTVIKLFNVLITLINNKKSVAEYRRVDENLTSKILNLEKLVGEHLNTSSKNLGLTVNDIDSKIKELDNKMDAFQIAILSAQHNAKALADYERVLSEKKALLKELELKKEEEEIKEAKEVKETKEVVIEEVIKKTKSKKDKKPKKVEVIKNEISLD